MPPFAPPHDSVLSRIAELTQEINGLDKAAQVKKADHDGETTLGHSGQGSRDPGGHQGPSSHVSAKVDSNTQSAPLGDRFRENHQDMTDQYAVGNVDRTSKGGGGDQDAKQLSDHQSATGEDPKVEDHYKGKKDDPGTSSVMNAEEVGHKYGSVQLPELTKMAYARMNECLADMVNGSQKTAAEAPPAYDPAAHQAQLAAQAGYDLAGHVANMPDPEMQKAAAVQGMIEHLIKTAEADADLVGDYLLRFAAERQRQEQEHQKQAEMPPEMAGAGPPPGGAGAMPPEMAGGGPPGGGALPPEAAGGGPPPDGGGGPEGGEGDHAEAINELANALIEMGIDPEQLIADLQHHGGGGGGAGGPPGGGPEEGAMAGLGGKAAAARLSPEDRQNLIKLAQTVKTHQRAGKVRIKEARPGSRERAERDEVKGYLLDLCGRG